MAAIWSDNTGSTTAGALTQAATANSWDGPAFGRREEDEDEPAYQNRHDYLRLLLERGQTWDVPHWRPLRWLEGLIPVVAWVIVRPWRKPRCDIPVAA